jgi:cyclomaltodextrinase
MSPIVQNPKEAYVEYPAPHRKYSGYHGYWPISSTQIDYRFGNEKVFKSTIQHAHHKNINILIDYVSNHVHEKHPLYINHKDWTTPIDLPDGRKNIRIWDEQRLTTWFDTFLPDIDYTKPEVIRCHERFCHVLVR